jgi:hypothetical protein
MTTVYQYIVRTPEQLDPDSVCKLNGKIFSGDKRPIPKRGAAVGDSQLPPLRGLFKWFFWKAIPLRNWTIAKLICKKFAFII